MDEILKKAEEIKAELYSLPEVKEYLKLKKLVEENEEIQSLNIQLKQVNGDEELEKKLLEELNNNPLLINYNQAKDEVIGILNIIGGIIKDL